jgi:hypothetical protein
MGRSREEPIDIEARLKTSRQLKLAPSIVAPATAKLIYDAIVKVADRTTETNKLLEAKANGVIALSSALLGFGANFANGQHVAHWGVAVGAITSLLLAIGCAFRAHLITTFAFPSPAYYNVYSIAADPENEGKIALELGEAWHRYTTDERTVGMSKNTWLNRSVAFMGLGLLAFAVLAVDVLLAARDVHMTQSVVH